MPTFEEIIRHHDPDPSRSAWVNGPPPPASVVIVDYDPRWPERYHLVAEGIRAALGPKVWELQHIGSTSVPGLAAKDIVDIDLTVADPRVEDAYVPALTRIGYTLAIREPSWHEHRCLKLDTPRVNLHVFGPDCPEVIRHRLFRDWLSTHPDDRARYVAAKRAAVAGGGSTMDYNGRKQDTIRAIYDRIFRAAGMLEAPGPS